MGAAEALGGLQQNVLGSPIGIGQHIRIPQPNNTPATADEIRRSSLVICRTIDVLAAVEFDDQSGAPARQIDNERRDDELSREGRAVSGNTMPDREFGRRRIVAQFARSSGEFRIDAATHAASVSWLAALAYPPPTPPLQGGELRRRRTAIAADQHAI